jgi:hypothetical protein
LETLSQKETKRTRFGLENLGFASFVSSVENLRVDSCQFVVAIDCLLILAAFGNSLTEGNKENKGFGLENLGFASFVIFC